LHLRTIVGPGVGYQIWEDPVKSLHLEAGISYVWTDYYEAQDIDYPSARLGAGFRYQPFKFLAFSDRILVYPNLKNGGEYTLRNEAALTSPLGSGWACALPTFGSATATRRRESSETISPPPWAGSIPSDPKMENRDR
jgi:hypothetical protein